jgi:hypothetical protein
LISNTRPTYPTSSLLVSTHPCGYRNINLLAIVYAFRPQLRFRLTLGGSSCPRNPWVYGGRGSHSAYRYSCQHNLRINLQLGFRSTFTGEIRAPLPLIVNYKSIASVLCLAPLHRQRRLSGPVSYYAFFKGLLLLSQPPGCQSSSTAFTT